MKNLIAISSGKGGVGKSTVAVNLAIALAHQGAAVGIMDADITGPNLPILIGVDRMPPPTSERLIPAEAFGVKVISMGFLVDPDKALIWRGPMIHGAIRQFFNDVEWGELDYMIIDLPPGTGDAQLTLAQSVPLTGAVIVTQPQLLAIGDARRGLEMFRQVNVPIIGVVENMSGDFFGEGGGKQFALEREVPFLGSVPLDPQVRIGGDAGQPVVVTAPDSPVGVAFREIARAVSDYVASHSDRDDGEISIRTIE
jgi:ATP-binding protein involved in chromosome partitioning